MDDLLTIATAACAKVESMGVEELTQASGPGERELGDELALAELKAALFGGEAPVRRIDRYRLVEELGRGGMGLVLRGFDEELDRPVAIKLLADHPDSAGERRARLAREARALARVSHPAIVQIYDIGEVDSSIWVAMELVEGQTLRGWLAGLEPGQRGWRSLLGVFIEIGEGLVAAHEAGLVHRDIKPENIMITPAGRARVLDFGLARLHADADELARSWSAADAQLDGLATLTRDGQIPGTPAYMAPEQFAGRRADALSDQFSFCVTLWEALYGRRPFASHELGVAQLGRAVGSGELDPPPAGRELPAWLDAALRRGLRVEPGERWPSMAALLELLRERPKRRARVAKLGLFAASVAGALALGLATAEQPRYCELDEAAFVDVWDAGRREALRDAFRATGLGFAELASGSAIDRLDGWQDRWLAAQRQACEDTRVTGIVSEEVLDQRTRCLHRQRRDFAAIVEILTQADARVAGRAAELLAGLPELDRCAAGAAGLAVAPPEDLGAREAVERGHDQLARAEGLRRVGDYDEARALARAATELGLAHDHAPLALAGRGMAASLQLDADAIDAGARELIEVIHAAERAHLDQLVGALRVRLATGVAGRWSQPSLEAMVLAEARAWLERDGGDEHGLRELARVEIKLGLERGELEPALTALTELRREPAPSDELRLREAVLAARLLARLGQLERARAELEAAAGEASAVWGAGAKFVADVEFDLGLMALEAGELERAERELAAAEAHYLALFGPDSADVVSVAFARVKLDLDRGELERAHAALEQLVGRAEAAFGPTDLETGDVYNALGITRFFMGDLEGSLRAYQRALALGEQAQGEHHPDVAMLRSNIGETLAALGRHEAALAAYQLALDSLALSYPPDHPDLAYPLKGYAKSLLAGGRAGEALPLLERALILRSGEQAEPFERADVLRSLALALAELGLQPERAGELAAEAAALFDGLDMPEERETLAALLNP